ncbi:MAG: DUF1176 domain-containing protein [Sphingomonas sp.]
MHRSILLAAPLALAACSSSTPDGNSAATPAPTATLVAANAAAPDATAPNRDDRATPQPGALKTFGDWEVGCDNINHCTMASLGPEGVDFPPINLTVERRSGPVGELTVTLFPNDGLAPKAPPTSVMIDGHVIGGTFPKGDTPSISGAAAQAIVAAMANGHGLEIRSASGDGISGLSLKGASAALRYIDAQQGRAGTQTAIVAKGDKPASAVPAGPVIPQIGAVVPVGQAFKPSAAMIADMKKQAGCDDTAFGDVESHALGGEASVVLVPCGSGAYNMMSALFVAKDGKVAPARLDAPTGIGPDDEQPAVPQVVNADFDKGVLGTYAKGRGLGDCGVTQDFVWDGTMFRLSEQAEMGECRGDPDYITTWTAKVSRR